MDILDIRWNATVFYRADNGIIDVLHELEELGDLDQLVESGPHWDTIEKIEIVRVNHLTHINLTVEEALKL